MCRPSHRADRKSTSGVSSPASYLHEDDFVNVAAKLGIGVGVVSTQSSVRLWLKGFLRMGNAVMTEICSLNGQRWRVYLEEER